MTRAPLWIAGAWLGMACAAASDVPMGRRCPEDEARCTAGGGGAPGGGAGMGDGGSSFNIGGAGVSRELTAHIEQNQMRVEFITVACAGDCADVVAVASDGHPPYAFTWEDGSTNAARSVCPTSATSYEVTVTDSGVSSPEFSEPPQTVTVPLTANVLECSPPDSGAGGSGDGKDSDGGGALCLENPSFEGTAAVDTGSNFDAPPWNNCSGTGATADVVAPGLLPFYWLPPPTNGATYLRMGSDATSGIDEFVTQRLCSPLEAGHRYFFTIDVLRTEEGTVAPQLAVYGSNNDCSQEELLWTSPSVEMDWHTVCVTLAPTQDASYLTLYPTGRDATNSAILHIDNLVPVASCP